MRRVVTGLPRSRTAWMSLWVSAMGAPAVHEMLAKVGSFQEYVDRLDHYVDCGTYVWLLEPTIFDRVIVIERPPHEVATSLVAALPDDVKPVDWQAAHETLLGFPGLHVGFDELDDRLEEIHDYLKLPVPFDPFLSRAICDLRVTMSMQSFTEDAQNAIENAEEALRLGFFGPG